MIRDLLELRGVSIMTDIQELFYETIAEFMEDGLEAELSEAPGCSKYDYWFIRAKIRLYEGRV